MRKVVLAIVAVLSASLAVPALAADATLSAATPNHSWEASGMMGGGQGATVPMGNARCTPAYQCHNTHIEVKDAGTLTVDIKAGEGSNDLDVRLFKSDEAGTAPGSPATDDTATSPVAADERTEPDAKITVRGLKPGFYVIQVAAYSAANGSFTGTANLAVSGAAPAPAPGATPPATTPPSTEPAPQQTSPTPQQNQADDAKRKKKLAACNKKAKKIKNAKKRKAAQKKCAKKYGKKKA